MKGFAFVVFCAALGWRTYALRDLDERAFLLPSGFPGTEIALRNSRPDVTAVLFHGFQCNRIMMTELGRYLAHAGIHVFLVDFPGHGASKLRFFLDTVAQQSAQAFGELVETYKISPATTAIIGHSFGSVALIKIAAVNPSIFSTVFIGPGYYGGASTDSPKNILVLTGERDHSYVIDFASQLLAASTNGTGNVVGRSFGQAPFLRLWKNVPATGHVALLYNRVTFDETLSWIRQNLTGDVGHVTEGYSFLGVCAAPAIAGLLLFVAILVSVSPHATPAPSSRVHPAEILLLFLTTPLSAFWVKYVDPLAPQRILEGSAIVSTLFMSGLLAGAIVMILTERRMMSRIRLKHIVVAFGYFSLIYAIASLTVSNDFYDLTLKFTGRRVSAFALFSLCSGVFFLVIGGILARLHGRLGPPLVRIVVMTLAVASMSLLLPLSLGLTAPTLLRFFGPMAVLLLFLFGLQLILLELSRDSLPCSIFSGLVVGWITSVAFLVN